MTSIAHIQKLAALGTPSSFPDLPMQEFKSSAVFDSRLTPLLFERNGFWAFESALYVFGFGDSPACMDIATWNAPETWKSMYNSDPPAIAFAEDIFGEQFCLSDTGILRFDPETGFFSPHSENLDDWAQKILADYSQETGWPFAHEWQVANRLLTPNQRLNPTIPFALGGDFAIENLFAVDRTDGMCFRAQIANQIAGLPDGSHVRLRVVE